MLKFENIEVVGFEHAIRGMRNPMNSWERSDSKDFDFYSIKDVSTFNMLRIGPNDLALMQKLVKGGPEHSKFRRMIVVYMDITGPLYWWKEFDTYKVGTVANSCSTMHKIAEKEFSLDDFSHEYLRVSAKSILLKTIEALNAEREAYIGEGLPELKGDKECWYSMIQLLPSSYNQRRTIMMNYEVLANICKPGSRRNHKLDEWSVDFMNVVKRLPYSKELIFWEE